MSLAPAICRLNPQNFFATSFSHGPGNKTHGLRLLFDHNGVPRGNFSHARKAGVLELQAPKFANDHSYENLVTGRIGAWKKGVGNTE
jgi:hypothetical protein